MKNFYKIKLWLLACLVVSFGFLSSCDDDDDNAGLNGGKVELLSFGPTGVKHGEEIRFIGYNLNKVESIMLPGATVTKGSFIEQTPELIRIIVPRATREGSISLKLSEGEDIVSKTKISFEVPVTITTVTSEARPGADITITGTNLDWAKGVMFEGSQDTVKVFSKQTATELKLQVPANAKTGPITVLTGGTEPLAIKTVNDLIVTLPALTAVAPATIRHAENLTLTGTNLDLVNQVVFPGGTKVSSFVSQTANQIVVKVPNNATNGALKLVTKGSAVEVATTPTVSIILPAITSITTVRHNQNATITGTNLDLVKEITFPDNTTVAMANFVSQSPTQIQVSVPGMTGPGKLRFKTTHDFAVAPSADFNVLLPSVSSYSPAIVAPNGILTINGTNMDLVKDITFAGMSTKVSTFLIQSATRIQVTVPTAAKTGVPKFTLASGYVVNAPELTVVMPTITSITPTPVAPGSYLSINGTNLTLVKSVKFTGGAEVTTFLTQTENQIIFMVPAAAKTGKLTLVTQTNTEVETTQEATIGTAAGPTIRYFIYDDALASGWQLWNGYNGIQSQNLDNTEFPKRGSKSFKIMYNGLYATNQLKPNDPNFLNGYSHIVLYVRGGAVNSRLAIQLKLVGGTFTGDQAFDVVAGEYNVIQIPLSSFGNISAGVDEFLIKNQGTNPNTIYIDDLGLR